MASKQEIFERRQKIVEILKANKEISVEELMETCGAKKRTLMDDIAELRNQGIEIKVGNGMVSLLKEIKSNAIEHVNSKIIRQVKILMGMGRAESIRRKDLFDYCKKQLKLDNLYDDFSMPEAQLEEKLATDRFRKSFEEDINELCDKNILCYDGEMIRKTLDTPVTYKMTEKDIYAMLSKIAISKQGEAYAEMLDQIEQKLNNEIVHKLGERHSFTDKVYTFEKKRNFNLSKGMALLKKVAYKERVLKISYKTKSGNTIEKEIGVGAIVYSEERAKLYLLAWTFENNQFSIYNLETVTGVEATSEENKYFMCKEIRDIIDEMFVVSVDEPHDVELEVDDSFYIKEKFERLCKSRKHGNITLSETPKKFIYRDRVRGLDDFARYIRGFGWACKVLAPEILTRKMVESNEEIIAMYEQYLEITGEK